MCARALANARAQMSRHRCAAMQQPDSLLRHPGRGLRFVRPVARPSRRALGGRMQPMAAGPKQMLVHVPPHPLVAHWLATLRSEMTPSPVFRSAAAELGRLLVYEASRDWLPTLEVELQTPMGPADGTIIDLTRPVKVVPILRAGLMLLEQAASVLPGHETYHVGLVRDETTLQPTEYLNKLPASFAADDRILVADPMMATGGTMVHVLDDIVRRGGNPELIRVLCITVAPPALKQLSEKYPGLKVYTATIDAEVNDQGFIVPGLGDAGDRAFGTA